MFQLRQSAFKIFLACLLLFVGVFVWAGITGTRLLGDGKDTYTPDGNTASASRVRTGAGTYHRFQHK